MKKRILMTLGLLSVATLSAQGKCGSKKCRVMPHQVKAASFLKVSMDFKSNSCCKVNPDTPGKTPLEKLMQSLAATQKSSGSRKCMLVLAVNNSNPKVSRAQAKDPVAKAMAKRGAASAHVMKMFEGVNDPEVQAAMRFYQGIKLDVTYRTKTSDKVLNRMTAPMVLAVNIDTDSSDFGKIIYKHSSQGKPFDRSKVITAMENGAAKVYDFKIKEKMKQGAKLTDYYLKLGQIDVSIAAYKKSVDINNSGIRKSSAYAKVQKSIEKLNEQAFAVQKKIDMLKPVFSAFAPKEKTRSSS